VREPPLQALSRRMLEVRAIQARPDAWADKFLSRLG
jgi:hypothetical protein